MRRGGFAWRWTNFRAVSRVISRGPAAATSSRPGCLYRASAATPCATLTTAPVTDATRAKVLACLAPRRLSNVSRALFLLGDSHAANYILPLEAATRGRGVELVFAAVGHGCGFNSEAFHAITAMEVARGVSVLPRCLALQRLMVEALQLQLRAGDVVCVSTYSMKFMAGWSGTGPRLRAAGVAYDEAFLASVSRFVSSRGASFVMLGDVPQMAPLLAGFGRDCRGDKREQKCLAPLEQLSEVLNVTEAERVYTHLAATLPRTHFFRAFDLFCVGGNCSGGHIPGSPTIALFDAWGHFTFEGGLYLSPFLACFLERERLLPRTC